LKVAMGKRNKKRKLKAVFVEENNIDDGGIDPIGNKNRLSHVHLKEPNEGSAIRVANVCRGVLWGIVEMIQRREIKQSKNRKIKFESKDTETDEISEENIDELGITLPFQFASKNTKKMKLKQTKLNTNQNIVLPEPPYANMNHLLEENIYKVLDNDSYSFVRILGVGPSTIPDLESFVIIRYLCKDRQEEVNRKRLLPLSIDEIALARQQVEDDITFRFESGAPEGVHLKYWDQRYRLMDRYDEGIQFDAESWYSITPQLIAEYTARYSLQCAVAKDIPLRTVLDCFCGCGGNSIAFAVLMNPKDPEQSVDKNGDDCNDIKVIGVEIDPIKIEHLRHNASIYGVHPNQLQLICSDVYTFFADWTSSQNPPTTHHPSTSTSTSTTAETSTISSSLNPTTLPTSMIMDSTSNSTEPPSLNPNILTSTLTSTLTFPKIPPIDLIIMSPPWGGPNYVNSESFDLESMLSCGPNGDGFDLLLQAAQICRNLVYILPRNTKNSQLFELGDLVGLPCHIQNIWLGKLSN